MIRTRSESARRLAGLFVVAMFAGMGASAGSARAQQDDRPRLIRQYWKAGPLGRYNYPSLLWRFEDTDRPTPARPPRVFESIDPLTPTSRLASCDGQFLDAETGRPIPEVEAIITRKGDEPVVIMTDSRGRFSALDVPAGEYTVASHAAGYYDDRLTVILAPERTNVVRLRLRPRPAGIAGYLRDADGQPIAGVKLVLREERRIVKELESLTDGSFGSGGLKPGRYVLEAVVNGRTIRQTVELKPGDIQTVELTAK